MDETLREFFNDVYEITRQIPRGKVLTYGRIAVLYFLEHKTTAEIAAAVGRPPATVNNQLWRAKNILRQQIIERRQRE